ncbi:hypothetical protein KKA95_03845 [Patescibacteria group bacterium]|nr:hypothetical protein [Patescibacteria group bacterium]
MPNPKRPDDNPEHELITADEGAQLARFINDIRKWTDILGEDKLREILSRKDVIIPTFTAEELLDAIQVCSARGLAFLRSNSDPKYLKENIEAAIKTVTLARRYLAGTLESLPLLAQQDGARRMPEIATPDRRVAFFASGSKNIPEKKRAVYESELERQAESALKKGAADIRNLTLFEALALINMIGRRGESFGRELEDIRALERDIAEISGLGLDPDFAQQMRMERTAEFDFRERNIGFKGDYGALEGDFIKASEVSRQVLSPVLSAISSLYSKGLINQIGRGLMDTRKKAGRALVTPEQKQILTIGELLVRGRNRRNQ